MQCYKNVIVSGPEAPNPVPRRTGPGVAHEFGSLGGANGERAERPERNHRDPVFDFQGREPRPGNRDVKAIVGLTPGDIRRIVPWPRFKPYVPVLGSGDLRGVRLVAIDNRPSSLRA